jgi:hypothetical protein
MITPDQVKEAMAYMLNQSVLFDLKVVEGNSISQRIHKDIEQAYKKSNFESKLLIAGNSQLYHFDDSKLELWTIKRDDILLEHQQSFHEHKNDLIENRLLKKELDAEELREYFFNFGDSTSFFLCRHLKNHPIKLENIVDLQFCQ